jgi:putative ABC transport system permease protein
VAGHLGHRGGTARTSVFQRGLVVAELALSLILLAGAALMAQSFISLVSTDPGFRTAQTVTAHVRLPASRYPDAVARAAFVERATELLDASPSIAMAGTIDALPLADDRQGTSFSIDGVADTPAVANANVNFAFVSPGYFEAMGIPVLRGRAFDGRDRPDGAPTIVVNEGFAERFFPGIDPIGRRIRMGFDTQAPREIVGIVGDERHVALDQAPPPGVFISYLQFGWSARLTLVARASRGTDAAVADMRHVVGQLDPGVPLYDVRTMETIVRESLRRPQFSTALLGMFAVAALLLAATGVYGVISQIVADRTREFGVRYALGATRGDVARLVLRFGGSLALAGTLVGLPAAFAFGRLLSGLLYGVSPGRPLPYLAVAALLALVAVVAALAPARRARRVDPIVALRAD